MLEWAVMWGRRRSHGALLNVFASSLMALARFADVAVAALESIFYLAGGCTGLLQVVTYAVSAGITVPPSSLAARRAARLFADERVVESSVTLLNLRQPQSC